MASVVLAVNNHATFISSIWGGWAGAPHDLLLVTEDGIVEAHCNMLLPLSRHLATVVETLAYTGPTQVVLAETSIKAAAAVKDLIYTGACSLEKPILPQILETLDVLGIEASSNSFSFKSVLESVEEEVEDAADVGGAINIKEETEDIVDAFEGIAVGQVFHNVETFLSIGQEGCKQDMKESENKTRDVPVKIPKLKFLKKLPVHKKENRFSCDINDCKLTFLHRGNLNKHIRSAHTKEKPHQCDRCQRKFSEKSHLKGHIMTVHNKEKPYQCHECLQKFSQLGHLSRHFKAVHNKLKPFQCNQCLKKFTRKENLRVHIVIMHQEKSHA